MANLWRAELCLSFFLLRSVKSYWDKSKTRSGQTFLAELDCTVVPGGMFSTGVLEVFVRDFDMNSAYLLNSITKKNKKKTRSSCRASLSDILDREIVISRLGKKNFVFVETAVL